MPNTLGDNPVVSSITGYVDENRDALIAGAVSGAKSAQILNLQVGYKSAGAINILNTDVVFQADAAGRTATGVTTLSQRVLTVGKIKIEEDFDIRALDGTYQQHNLKAGSKNEAVPFAEAWTSLKVEKVSHELEKAIWQGDTGGAANLQFFDGFIKIIDAAVTAGTATAGAFVIGTEYQIVTAGTTDFTLIGAADSVVGTKFVATGAGTGTGTALNLDTSPQNGNTGKVTAATGITAANVIALLDGVYNSIPLSVLESGDINIMIGFDTFRLYTQALKDANLYHYAADASNFEIMLAGTNVKVVALQGLSGTDRMFAGKPSNFVIGTDLANEEEEFDVWYSKEDKVVKLDMAFKYGCQIAFPAEIVEFTLVP